MLISITSITNTNHVIEKYIKFDEVGENNDIESFCLVRKLPGRGERVLNLTLK